MQSGSQKTATKRHHATLNVNHNTNYYVLYSLPAAGCLAPQLACR